MRLDVDTPLERVLGAKTGRSMAESLDLHTVRDLLRHYPRRYAQRGEMADLTGLEVGDRVTVLAQIRSVETRRMRNRPGTITEVTVGDGRGRMRLVFFSHKHGKLVSGAWGLFAGTVSSYKGQLQFTHPDMHLLDGRASAEEDDRAQALIPIYP